jgi:hypothetical protein
MSEYTYSGDSYDVYSSLSFAYQAYATSSSDSGDGYSYAKDALSDEEGNVEDVITEEPQVSKDWNAGASTPTPINRQPKTVFCQ